EGIPFIPRRSYSDFLNHHENLDPRQVRAEGSVSSPEAAPRSEEGAQPAEDPRLETANPRMISASPGADRRRLEALAIARRPKIRPRIRQAGGRWDGRGRVGQRDEEGERVRSCRTMRTPAPLCPCWSCCGGIPPIPRRGTSWCGGIVPRSYDWCCTWGLQAADADDVVQTVLM